MKIQNTKSFRIANRIAICVLALVSAKSFAAPVASGDEYSNPTPGAVSSVAQQIIDKDKANIACNGSLCTLFSVTVNKKNFNITTYVGDGMPRTTNGGGTNNYYGNTNPYDSNSNGKIGYGVQVTWDNTNCTKNIDVDKSVYDSVTTYMRELLNSTAGEPSTYPQFTPAEQTMILFYTTVMDLTKGSTCN